MFLPPVICNFVLRTSSTTKCTFALTETVNYFRKNKSNVYVMVLDATKAFDKVNYVKLLPAN